MKTLLLLLIFSSYTYAYIDESALAGLQTLDHWNTFRIALPNTNEECFYLETKINDTIHVIYQVLKGGDSRVRITISDPLGQIPYANANSEFGWYDDEHLKIDGTYRICFKNEQYFTTKTLYIGVLAIHPDRLLEANMNAAQEKNINDTAAVEEFSLAAQKSFSNIASTLYRVNIFQTIARAHHAHDLYWVEANAYYVQNWAICQIITMIICSLIQVFSIRQLFKTTISNKKYTQNSNLQTPHFIIAS